MDIVTEARELARSHIAFELPRRWKHVEATAREAERIAPIVGNNYVELTTAAWLLDIGHAPELVETELHQLDGARFLESQGWIPRIVNLVAHHCGAVFEARVRGMYHDLDGYHDEKSPTRDALWYCDLTTGPDGERVDVEDRLAEIATRYGPDHPVTRSIAPARDELLGAVRRTRQLLRSARLA